MNKSNQAISVGISSCLMGMKVRHDGGHKNFGFAMNNLKPYFNFETFCPEMAAGMPVPRPAIHQIKTPSGIRLVDTKHHKLDVTDAIINNAKQPIEAMSHLAGYILKKDSPSCGMERVRVYNHKGQPEKTGIGIFTKMLSDTYPNLPIEEEGRLMDPVLRENFVERVFTYQRWANFSAAGHTVQGLIAFHTQHKFSVLSHNEVSYRNLGKLVAKARNNNLATSCEQYINEVMCTLKQPANRKTHTNVLMHLMGYFKSTTSSEEKRELRIIFDNYRLGMIPLIVPITMLKHYLNRTSQSYLMNQTYLNPYPNELSLRNSL